MQKCNLVYLFSLFAAVSLLVHGCTRSDQTNDTDNRDTAQQSTLQTVTDGITGRHAVRAGQKAQEQIREIVEQRNKDLEPF